MSGPGKRKDLKSSGAGKPLRSRGFLSHSGEPSRSASGAGDIEVKPKSRGMKQALPRADGKPRALTAKTATKPYRLEDT